MKFIPKPIICTQSSLTYRYTCKNIHNNEVGHPITNTYRFNKGVPYLVKNQADYDELIAIDIFVDYETPEQKAKSAEPETTKQRKLREKAEAKANKEAAEKAKAEAKNIPDGMTKEEAGQSKDTYLEPNLEIKDEED